MPVTLAVASLRQQALDFIGNRERIIESIKLAKQKHAKFRVGPELEITGYGCWDHFLESDTYFASWQSLMEIIKSDVTNGIICDIGMPIVHRNVRYNCRIVMLDGRIILIRPKMVMADGGNYHESRWFAMWPRGRLEEYHLPRMIRKVTGQTIVPFGEAILSTTDGCIGFEICEELFASNSPRVTMALAGVEIFSNGSASHHEIGKLSKKIKLIETSMAKTGGIYLYSNALGCDGDRVYFDGASMIVANDELIACDGLFSLQDVVVTTATMDLEEVRTFRGMKQCMCNQVQYTVEYPRIKVDFVLSDLDYARISRPLSMTTWTLPSICDQIGTASALWLFDYLRRSGAGGFLVPLSGGLDSASVSLIVYELSRLLANENQIGNAIVKEFLKERLCLNLQDRITTKVICNKLLTTCYMATQNSSPTSRTIATCVAEAIGSFHLDFNFDPLVSCFTSVISLALKFIPKYQSQGGSSNEDIALQNIQARLRLVLAYAIAQLGPLVLNRSGPILVLATSNACETLRGYFTKYDNSSGDLNPLGSFSKSELRKFIQDYCKQESSLDNSPRVDDNLKAVLCQVLAAIPTAELIPRNDNVQAQEDEREMGITYDDLNLLGFLRISKRCGPYSMIDKLERYKRSNPSDDSKDNVQSNANIMDIVTKFHHYYAINRHKSSSLPPTFHASPNCPDDNRFDLRPLFYPKNWPFAILALSNDNHDQGVAISQPLEDREEE